MFGKSFEDKVNAAVAQLGAHGIKNANYKLEGKVVTLTGMAHDPATKAKAVAWFNEQVDTENTLNMIKVEVPSQEAAATTPGGPGKQWGTASTPTPHPTATASAAPPSTAPTATRADGPAAERIHVVEKGDTLSALSKKYYGRASDYMKIYDANTDMLKDPDKIYPGQRLKIPN